MGTVGCHACQHLSQEEEFEVEDAGTSLQLIKREDAWVRTAVSVDVPHAVCLKEDCESNASHASTGCDEGGPVPTDRTLVASRQTTRTSTSTTTDDIQSQHAQIPVDTRQPLHKLCVQRLSGDVCELHFRGDATITDVKQQIEAVWGVRKDAQTLMIGDQRVGNACNIGYLIGTPCASQELAITLVSDYTSSKRQHKSFEARLLREQKRPANVHSMARILKLQKKMSDLEESLPAGVLEDADWDIDTATDEEATGTEDDSFFAYLTEDDSADEVDARDTDALNPMRAGRDEFMALSGHDVGCQAG